jgi:sugar phosphate permease
MDINYKSFLNSIDWKLQAKALALGFIVFAKFLLAIVVSSAIISTIVTFIGWQSIPIVMMIGIIIYFAWMIGHVQLEKKKRDELKMEESSK